MTKANLDIRRAINEAGLMLYQVADKYGCNDGNFSRKLRREFSTEEKVRLIDIIEELKAAM